MVGGGWRCDGTEWKRLYILAAGELCTPTFGERELSLCEGVVILTATRVMRTCPAQRGRVAYTLEGNARDYCLSGVRCLCLAIRPAREKVKKAWWWWWVGLRVARQIPLSLAPVAPLHLVDFGRGGAQQPEPARK